MNKRRWLVLAFGIGALGGIGGMAPWVYRWIRVEQIIAQLEAGDNVAARAALVAVKGLDRATERLLQTRSAAIAANFVELAVEGHLPGIARNEAFNLQFPLWLHDPKTRGAETNGVARRGRTVVTVRAQDSLWELLDYRSSWGPQSILPLPSSGRVELYVQYFLAGEGADARLVHHRSVWVVHPTGSEGSERDASGTPIFRVEMQDLTDVPDPIQLFPRRPVAVILPTGESALEIRLASMGTWRQFVPGRRLYNGSVAYAIYLDRSGVKKDPFLLGYVGVSAATSLGTWFAEDAVLGEPIVDLDKGAHRISLHVPRSAAILETFSKVKLLFRPAPSFAERNGFQVSAPECLPFERELRIPAFER